MQGHSTPLEVNSQPLVITATTLLDTEHKEKCVHGLFLALPTEILHSLFGLLDLSELGQLALVSKGLNQAVEEYIYTNSGHRRVIPAASSGGDDEVNPLDFRKLGFLLKRVTAFRSLKYQLKTASFFLNKLKPVHCKICEVKGTSTSYHCFGELLNSYTAGWDEYKKIRAYSLVVSVAKLDERTNKVLSRAPESFPWHEQDIRLFHRLIFLIPAKSDVDYGFWLTQILKPWPITFQARLLYLLTAPEDSRGCVSWTQVCGCSNVQHSSGSVDFREVARALWILRTCRCKDWSQDDIISIFDELTSTPNSWCLENVAQLLMLSGSEVTHGVLGSRAISGRVEELSVLLYYLAHACVSADEKMKCSDAGHLKWFTCVMRHVFALLPSAKDKRSLSTKLMATWQNYLTALFEENELDGDESEHEEIKEEFCTALTSLTNLSAVLAEMVVDVTQSEP